MEKETIFFSHSSRDSKAVNYLKSLIQDKTRSVLNIFLSSDGQSIPFGTNWVHQIEQGLDVAVIMFVFITPNSMGSNWIYFESGFAYSKKVKVIPIGMGFTINKLNPPLNLLQGFNLTSKEGINNIVTIINNELQTNFKEDASDEEFNTLVSLMGYDNHDNALFSAIDFFETGISNYTTQDKEEVNIDVDKIFEFILKELTSKEYEYAHLGNRILFNGLDIRIVKSQQDKGVISFKIVADAFETHLDTFKCILKEAYADKEKHYINIYLSKEYDIITNELKLSSIINRTKDIKYSQESKELEFSFQNLNFHILDTTKVKYSTVKPYLRVIFDMSTKGEDIFNLVQCLIDLKIINRER